MTAGVLDQGRRPSVSSNLRPTTIRWRIMAMVTLVNMLPSLGKVSMGVTGKLIQDEFVLSDQTMGWILSAFVIGFGLFQVPGGWAGDRYGPRKVLTLTILWYSVFLAVMSIVPELPMTRWLGVAWSFALIRFLIGSGEAFTSSNSAKVVSSWMSSGKLAMGVSFYTLGIGAGGALTPMLIAWTMQHWGWRVSFRLCGLVGVFIAFAWGFYVTDRPETHRGVNAAELDLLSAQSGDGHRPMGNLAKGRPPWGRMLSSSSVWSLLLSYMCRSYAIYFFDTWFFLYLVRARGLSITRSGIWGGSPYIAILLLSPIGGWFSDKAVNRLGKRRGRQVAAWIGMACSAIFISIGATTSNNTVAILLVATAAGFNMFASITCWAACIDLAPNYAASLSGLMNMCGALSGWLAPILTAYIVASYGWTRALDVIAGLSVVGGLLWFLVKADRNIEGEFVLPTASVHV